MIITVESTYSIFFYLFLSCSPFRNNNLIFVYYFDVILEQSLLLSKVMEFKIIKSMNSGVQKPGFVKSLQFFHQKQTKVVSFNKKLYFNDTI